jgi:CubicO group peptidase (beta-lactamase class C family)
MTDLQDFVSEKAEELGVPGVAAGVVLDGHEHTAFHGVTSVENPLAVDGSTIFQFGSTGKTFTATAIMRLVDQGEVDLDAPVRRYVPELTLKDAETAERVTVLQLLNHTAGWQGDSIKDTGDGDDALAKYVASMAELEQVSPLGSTVSYNNASLMLAGYLIANVTGTTYERAMRELLFEPLGMDMTFFSPNEIMTRRFVCGHSRHDDGTITVARPWALPRSGAPAGGMSATVGDQLTWARFHLGDGRASDGTRVLSTELLHRMQQPTADMRGSALGDYVGITWLLKDVDGTRLVSHGGTMHGQYSDFTLVPSRGFAVTCLSNSAPHGPQLNHAVTNWALEHYVGVKEEDLTPGDRTDDELSEYAGTYETIEAWMEVAASRGALEVQMSVKPDALRAILDAGEDEPRPQPPVRLGMLPGSDRYVVAEGPATGMRGYFSRDASGRVDGLHLGGRLASRARVST